MGAYRSIRHRLEDSLAGGVARRVHLRYVGRPWRASPSEGYPTAHVAEQQRIVRTRSASGRGLRVARNALRSTGSQPVAVGGVA